ncbi:MAG: DUF4157 domain-containing protein [Spirochaetales bacterium]|nr:DUF4157 domain-containing protein [Spirochaetales bacterium]
MNKKYDKTPKNSQHPDSRVKVVPPYSPLALLYDITTLQQTIGNQEVQRLIQNSGILPKLYVNNPHNASEQEADRVAEKVVQIPRTDTEITPPHISQLKDTHGAGVNPVGGEIESDIKALEGKGSPLPKSVRDYLQPRFGVDLEDVRIHTNSNADRLARAIKARAFVHGNNVVFAKGEYDPSSSSGKKLIAHELTHVIQQGAGKRPEDKNNSSTISAKNNYFDFTGTSPGTSLNLADIATLNDLIKTGRFDIMEYAYLNKPARDKSIKDIEKNNLAYIPALPFHYKNYNPLGWTFVQGSNYIHFTKDAEKDPKVYYLVWTKLKDGVATVLDSYEFKAGKQIPYGDKSFTIDELWEFSKTAREEFLGLDENGEQKSAWLTLCNYAFGITSKGYSGSHLRNPEKGGIYSIGDILKNMYNGKNNTEDYVYVETNWEMAAKYAHKGGYAIALNAHPDYWHGATMVGFSNDRIPQVYNAGWASWGTGIMNLGAAFGYNKEKKELYNSPDMHYFVLIKNPADE